MFNSLLNMVLLLSVDTVEPSAIIGWQTIIASFVAGGSSGAVVSGLINHFSNSSLRKKNAEHETEMQKREAEYNEKIKSLELLHKKDRQEKDEKFKKDFEALKNKYGQDQRIAEAINTYLSCAGAYFTGCADLETEKNYNAAHSVVLRYLPPNCAMLVENIYSFYSNDKDDDAAKVIPALTNEIIKEGLPL